VLNNLKLYKKQASTFLSFSGKNKALIKFNSKWLAKMKFSEVIELASKVTVDQMLKRDMFRERMDGGKPVYMHEFLYPLMQGFDSVVMDVDGEIGGNDQTFNMLTGRDLMKSLKNKDKFVIATKLLVDSSGKKMGKTEGNMITFADGPSDMFGKVMSWPDSMIIPGFELSTYISLEEIEKEKQFLVGGNPRDAKLRLAHAIVSIYHGTKAADKAQEEFRTAFSSGGIPGDTLTVSVNLNTPLVDILIANNIVTSKTEFHRLVSQQAVRNLILGDWVSHHDFKVASNLDLKVGKHRFIKIRVK
jgi:tyrosyl-tRNA synthetase